MRSTLSRVSLIAALLGTTSVPALAEGGIESGQVRGSFTIGTGYLGYEGGGEGDTADTGNVNIAGGGSAAVFFSQNWVGQIDLVGEQVVLPGDIGDAQYAGAQGAAIHVVRRWPGTGLIGVFGGYGEGRTVDDDTGSDNILSGGWIGIEGVLWLDQFTLGGQLASLDISDHDGNDYGLVRDAYLGRMFGRYFFGDDVMAGLDLAWAQGDDPFDCVSCYGDAETFEWTATVQARLADAPIYGGLMYRDGNYKLTEDSKADTSTLMVSLSFLFGANSLKENDRNGVMVDTSTAPLRGAGAVFEIYNY
jgi:hypothetical protein